MLNELERVKAAKSGKKRSERSRATREGRQKWRKRAWVEIHIRLVSNMLEGDWNARLRELVQGRVGGRAAK
jgi:hypothetical protein